jgi:hypothetical protein
MAEPMPGGAAGGPSSRGRRPVLRYPAKPRLINLGSRELVRRVLHVFVAISLVLTGVFFAGRARHMWAPEQPLGPLKQDPLAAEDLLGLELKSSEEEDGVGLLNLVWYDPHTPLISRGFAPLPEGSEATAAMIAAYAEANGWTPDFAYPNSSNSLAFTKPYHHSTMYLGIHWDDFSKFAFRRGVAMTLKWMD